MEMILIAVIVVPIYKCTDVHTTLIYAEFEVPIAID